LGCVKLFVLTGRKKKSLQIHIKHNINKKKDSKLTNVTVKQTNKKKTKTKKHIKKIKSDKKKMSFHHILFFLIFVFCLFAGVSNKHKINLTIHICVLILTTNLGNHNNQEVEVVK